MRRDQAGRAVRILVGSGVRESKLCGLAVAGPDGLPDLMLDSLQRGRVELRVRWDGGAKGTKSRRVPVTPKLASAIKRYEGRYRRDVEYPNLLINRLGQPYRRFGIDAMMDRLQPRVGFRVHAHGFRHTFATVATQLGWNLEHVRAAMDTGGTSAFTNYPLDIASWGSRSPQTPGWSTWTFWQTTSGASVPGINGSVDADMFNGDADALGAFVRGNSATTMPKP